MSVNTTLTAEYDNVACELSPSVSAENVTFVLTVDDGWYVYLIHCSPYFFAIQSVHEGNNSFATTLNMMIEINNVSTTISQQEIKCDNEFTVHTDTSLDGGPALSSQNKADLATIKLVDTGLLDNLGIV